MKNQTDTPRLLRRDGWSPLRRECFLTGMALGLPVGAVMQAVGLSRTAAYALARRDAGFAADWAAAAEIAKPAPDIAPFGFAQAGALSNKALMHRLRHYNIGRGRTLIDPRP